MEHTSTVLDYVSYYTSSPPVDHHRQRVYWIAILDTKEKVPDLIRDNVPITNVCVAQFLFECHIAFRMK